MSYVEGLTLAGMLLIPSGVQSVQSWLLKNARCKVSFAGLGIGRPHKHRRRAVKAMAFLVEEMRISEQKTNHLDMSKTV